MSIWNTVLQASHSALIDTLNEKFPDDKLELGLPKRFEKWATPEHADHILIHEINSAEGTGILALAMKKQDAKVGAEIFQKTLLRAEKEFQLRKIEAAFKKPIEKAPELRMTIWLPIQVAKGTSFPIFDLAVGI